MDQTLLLAGIDDFNAPKRLQHSPQMHPGLTGIAYISALLKATCKTLVVVGETLTDLKLVRRTLMAVKNRAIMCVSVSSDERQQRTCKLHANMTFFGVSTAGLREILRNAPDSVDVIRIVGVKHIIHDHTRSYMTIKQGDTASEFIANCMVCRDQIPVTCIQTLWKAVTCLKGKARMTSNSSAATRRNPKSASLAIVCIESRPMNWSTALSLAACMANLVVDDAQPLHPPILFTNYERQYREMLNMIDTNLASCVVVLPLEDADGIPLDENNFSLHRYSHMLMTEAWWKRVLDRGVSHALMIQDDGTLARPCDVMREFGNDHDYVGAPWIGNENYMQMVFGMVPDGSGRTGGNGGFSLRNVRAMTDACAKGSDLRSFMGVPEDVFFGKMVDVDRLPTVEVASKFSSEFAISTNPPSYGFHKIWAYNGPEDVTKYFEESAEYVNI